MVLLLFQPVKLRNGSKEVNLVVTLLRDMRFTTAAVHVVIRLNVHVDLQFCIHTVIHDLILLESFC